MEMIEEKNSIEISNNIDDNLINHKELEENYDSRKEFQKINKKILDLLNKDFDIPLNIKQENVKAKILFLLKMR